MEKISGILPANARVTTVDLRNSGTSRSGMPNFGRDVGVSAIAERKMAREAAMREAAVQGPNMSGIAGQTFETSKVANSAHKDQIGLRTKVSDPKSDIVQKMADDFFMNKARQLELQSEAAIPQEIPAEDSESDELDLAPASTTQTETSAADSESESDDSLVVGQHLDVHA